MMFLPYNVYGNAVISLSTGCNVSSSQCQL